MAKTFEQAQSIVLESVAPLGVERIPLQETVGRVLGEDLTAPWDMPLWDNSAMDGFAVRAADCQPGTTLSVDGYLAAGASCEGMKVKPGTAVKIMTGAPVPEGADAIVPIEETEEGEGRVTFLGEVKVGDHLRRRGEDVAVGEVIMTAGTRLDASDICMLAAFSQVEVPVYRQARVAILATGDELVEPGEDLAPGKIVNSNSLALAAAVEEAGAVPVLLGIARDNLESLKEKIAAGLEADMLVTSAGVSAGDRDFVPEVLAGYGVETLFSKVLIKPGKPTTFGVRNGVPVFALPGNPVSSLITFEQFVRPALRKMMGYQTLFKPTFKAVLSEPMKKKAGRLFFIRVVAEREGERIVAASAGNQHTGVLKSLVKANAIARLPADRERFEAGESVDIQWLDNDSVL